MIEYIKIDDINIGYYTNETNSKNTIILLHGWGQNFNCFKNLINVLEENYKIYAIDLPGFGLSEEPKTNYTIYDYENIFTKFIKEKKINDFDLIAHSFGGRIALIYASKNDNIKHLILTGCAGLKPQKSFKDKLKIYHYKFMKLLTKTIFYKQFYYDLIENSGSEDYKNASPRMKEVLKNTVNEDLFYTLNKIKAKTFLYWGANDDATPLTDGYTMKEEIKNSEIFIQYEGDHFAFLTFSNEFIKKVVNFLKI